MKVVVKSSLIKGLIAIFIILAVPQFGMGKTPEEIFEWVAIQMEIDETVPMPHIIFLDKASLQEKFKKSNKNSQQRWEEEYGQQKANSIMEMYLKELLGLFDPKTQNVYVGNFLEPCKKQTILAHEITHYFQTVANKGGPSEFVSPNEIYFFRELEAYSIEKRFSKQFCESAPK